MVSVDAFLISDRSSFQSRGAATLKARTPNLSLVRGTPRSPLDAERVSVIESGDLDTDVGIRRFATCGVP